MPAHQTSYQMHSVVPSALVYPYHSLFLRVHSAEKLQPLYPKDIASGGNKNGNLFYCKVYLGPKAMHEGSINNQNQNALSKWLLGDSHTSNSPKKQEPSNANVQILKTKVEAGGKSHSPVWNEKLSFKSYRSDMPQILTIRVKDSHSLFSASVGACVINLHQLLVDQTVDQFFPIYKAGTIEPMGRLRLQLLVSTLHEDPHNLAQQQLQQQKYEHLLEAKRAKSMKNVASAVTIGAATETLTSTSPNNQEEEIDLTFSMDTSKASFYGQRQHQDSQCYVAEDSEFEEYEDDDGDDDEYDVDVDVYEYNDEDSDIDDLRDAHREFRKTQKKLGKKQKKLKKRGHSVPNMLTQKPKMKAKTPSMNDVMNVATAMNALAVGDTDQVSANVEGTMKSCIKVDSFMQNQFQKPARIPETKQKEAEATPPSGVYAAATPFQYATHPPVLPNPNQYQHQPAYHQQYPPPRVSLGYPVNKHLPISHSTSSYGLHEPMAAGAPIRQQYTTHPSSQPPASTQPAYYYQLTPSGQPPAYGSQFYRQQTSNVQYYGAIPHVRPDGKPASYHSPCGPAPLAHPLPSQIPIGPPPPYNLDSETPHVTAAIPVNTSTSGNMDTMNESKPSEQTLRGGSFDL